MLLRMYLCKSLRFHSCLGESPSEIATPRSTTYTIYNMP